MEQTPQWSGHSMKPDRVQEVSGQCFQAWCACPVQGQEVDFNHLCGSLPTKDIL